MHEKKGLFHMSELAHMSVLVSGEVQGVGYRAFVQRHALDLGLSGYAENLNDGRVEVVVEGLKSELEHLLVKLKVGPAHALVENLEVSWGQVAQLEGFYVY
jgi:acylphosphatase